MTTSNHRPYTFPPGKIDLPQGKREGEVKYTDYAIGLDANPMNDALLNEAIAYYQTASRAFKSGALKESENLNP